MNIILELTRFSHGDDATCGILTLNGDFQCITCEDEFRFEKVSRETRIPAGTYPIKLRTEGGMLARYKNRYPNLNHTGMLWLQDVPGFEWVYIHVGNTEKDTEGCILVGNGFKKSSVGGWIQDSSAAYVDLYKKIAPAIMEGEEVYIIVRDHLGA